MAVESGFVAVSTMQVLWRFAVRRLGAAVAEAVRARMKAAVKDFIFEGI